MTDLFACAPMGRVNVAVNGNADTASALIVTGNYFRVLDVGAKTGGPCCPTTIGDATPVAVISHRYWFSRFGGASDVVGTRITVNNVPVTVVGVISPDFTGVQQAVPKPPDVACQISLEPQMNSWRSARLSQPTFWWVQVMGRLKPGVTPAQVQANLAEVFQCGGAIRPRFLPRLAVRGRAIDREQSQPHRDPATATSTPAAAAYTTSTRPSWSRRAS